MAYTSDGGSPGGKAIFHGNASPEWAEVCDNQEDGMRVWAHVYWQANGDWNNGFTLTDADGSSDPISCDGRPEHREKAQIPEGAHVVVDVCLRNGASGPKKHCGSVIGKA
ncbi:hypothetical protein DMA15_26650 [Streptomyces sp. WAC 01529]|uniref:hypothetical protein n=1 Tax=Streptomyces sp. WAC 01529 TaxID=2203205 RepID=UPI000F720D40|nr:hypothetical protein [Streptomyces sp. WAC 01529]AZM55725.1 hypothetical protein DMA15_26650 [Streptomyces sp. WAC 01529]